MTLLTNQSQYNPDLNLTVFCSTSSLPVSKNWAAFEVVLLWFRYGLTSIDTWLGRTYRCYKIELIDAFDLVTFTHVLVIFRLNYNAS